MGNRYKIIIRGLHCNEFIDFIKKYTKQLHIEKLDIKQESINRYSINVDGDANLGLYMHKLIFKFDKTQCQLWQHLHDDEYRNIFSTFKL